MPRKETKPKKKVARRRKGEGTIGYRKNEDRWYYAYPGPDGKRIFGYAKTRELAEEALDADLTSIKRGEFIRPDRITFAELAREWLDNVKKGVLRDGTYDDVAGIIQNYIEASPLGKIQVQKLTARELQRLVAAMVSQGLKPNSIRQYFGIPRAALGYAVKIGIITKNPCQGVQLPKIPDGERRIFTIEECHQILEALRGHWMEEMVELALATGMRQGELLALKWKHIDLKSPKKTLRVLESVGYVRGKGLVVGPAKTDSGIRKIPLAAPTAEMLKAYRIEQSKDRLQTDDDLLFPAPKGGYCSHVTVNYVFHKIVNEIVEEPEEYTFHCFRHTFVAIAIKAKTHASTIAKILGHKDAATTMKYYSHLFDELPEEAVEQISSVFEEGKLKNA